MLELIELLKSEITEEANATNTTALQKNKKENKLHLDNAMKLIKELQTYGIEVACKMRTTKEKDLHYFETILLDGKEYFSGKL